MPLAAPVMTTVRFVRDSISFTFFLVQIRDVISMDAQRQLARQASGVV
jgi:hypothetical protein